MAENFPGRQGYDYGSPAFDGYQPEPGIHRVGDGIYEVVKRPLEGGEPLDEGERSGASQEALDKNNEQYWATLLELHQELLERQEAGDPDATQELQALRLEMRSIYNPNATKWAEKQADEDKRSSE